MIMKELNERYKSLLQLKRTKKKKTYFEIAQKIKNGNDAGETLKKWWIEVL